ncbi:MAG TPA: M64 family metallopeptidase [Flavobacteriaceae bacterium]|nr:M64 family metallopeptidase [Flavobacteriaceae bacterium]
MKKTVWIFLFFCTSIIGFTQTFDTVLLLDNGPSDKRINLVVLGDGYDASEQDVFMADATQLIDYLFTTPPFSNYSNYFNVYAVKIISPESGVKHPGTATDVAEPVFPISNPNTYLETTFDYQDIHRCIYTPNLNKTTQVLAANVPFYDEAFVIVNSPEYGGCAGLYSYFSAHSSANEIMVHELGHSFSGLADEYWFAPTGESPNKTQDSNSQTNRWRNWIGTDGVDVYPYEEDASWYRPHQNCVMRSLGNPFCSVCMEATIERVHQLQGPIESFSPLAEIVEIGEQSIDFEVALILPEPNDLVLSWELNNEVVEAQQANISIVESDLEEGDNFLVFRVIDNTPLVRTDNHHAIHVSTVTWVLNKETLGVEDMEVSENSFVLYPNPTANVVHVKSNQSLTSSLTYELVTSTGQLAKKGEMNLSNSKVYAIELSDLPPQVYILNVYDSQSNKLYTQKIVKK